MKSSDPPVYFGEWVKKRRKALDLTQVELAHKSGCSVFALRKIESGERRPSKQLAGLLAKSLDISPEEKEIFIRVARGEVNLERLHAPSLDTLVASIIPEFQPASLSSNIPLQITPLIGREAELSAMEKLFNNPECRLLTLTGMGGIGKTRLAIEFATLQRSAFQGGVFYIPLAPINTTEAIVPAVADAIGFVFSGPTDPKEQLLSYIANRLNQPVLLVLDNLEHLLIQPSEHDETGIVSLVSEFLQRVPNLKFVATSRERLNLRGEWTYELHGLPVPPWDFSGEMEDYSAVALFVLSARRSKLDFEITPQEQAAVIKICQLLDGIPLATELAAAWVGILSCREIAHEINSNIDFLSTSMRDIPERHRSIRASFDHSWKLLSNEEKDALCQLSVFRGGFDRVAVEEITGASLTLLASLVSKSLVHRMENGRFDLHEVIRQFASDHLDAGKQGMGTRDRHCNYYLKFARDLENGLKSASQQNALRELTDEMDNVREAWAYAIDHQKYLPVRQAIRSLGWYFEATGLLGEGIDHFEPLVVALRDKPLEESKVKSLGLALMQQGLLYFRKGNFSRAHHLFEESINILRLLDDRTLMTDAMVYLGVILHLDGKYDQSHSTLEEALACAKDGNDEWFAAYALYNLGYIDSLKGYYIEGYQKMMAGLESWRALGDPYSISLGLNFLVTTLIKLERYEEAKSNMQESIRLCTQSKNRWGMGTAYRYFGLATLAQGNFPEAQTLFRKSLEIFDEFVIGWDIARTLSYLGDATRMAGDLTEAKQIYLDALQLSLEGNAIPIALDCLFGLAEILFRTGEIEAGLRLSYHVQNNPASVQETKDRAGELSTKLATLLKPPQVKAAQSEAEIKSINEIVDVLLASSS